ncbi:MAG TPA: DUF2911 domain-containing protein, partial [Gemmatimonadales bacterium]|nr:DUF2911 domain-containing protein [Gemmatimonadales bacterium]
TVLGRDTIALESFSRTASRLQGDILLRIPGTVLFHYLIDTRPDGSVSHSAVRLTPMGAPDLAPRIVTLDFVHGTVRAVVDSAGSTRRATFEAPPSATPILTTGFNDSFGLYASFGMYELLLTGPSFRLTDSVTAPAVGALTGELGSKRFARRSPTQVDVDYFGMAWTHLVVSGHGRIQSADGMETTEKTRTQRTGPVDVVRAAKKFAARDRDGKGLGIASPRGTVRTMLGPAHIAIDYSSPRKRGRTILGSVVPYGQVWRTGANAATTLYIDRPLTVGTVALPVGGYSLYTLPQADGVQLIINRQVGQWGTEYDASQDLARLPMRISVSATPREEFAITVTGQGDTGELRIQWDTFVWTVPLKVQ